MPLLRDCKRTQKHHPLPHSPATLLCWNLSPVLLLRHVLLARKEMGQAVAVLGLLITCFTIYALLDQAKLEYT